MSLDEMAEDAIKHALKALRKRHLLEEGAHAPAFIAISRPFLSQKLEQTGPVKLNKFFVVGMMLLAVSL